MPTTPQKITTCLCFDSEAQAAVDFYASVFGPEVRVLATTYRGRGEFGGPEGSVRTIAFQLFGQDYLAVNGGPHFKFSDAVSLMVYCDTQDEIDALWDKLSEGGRQVQCGWLADRFGVSWQVVPRVLSEMIRDPDTEKSNRVMQAVLQMVKLDIATLRQAYLGTLAA